MSILYDLTSLQLKDLNAAHGGMEYSKAVLLMLLKKAPGNSVCGLFDSEKKFEQEINDIIIAHNVYLIDLKEKENLTEIIKVKGIKCFFSPLLFELYAKYEISLPDDINLVYTVHGLRGIELPGDKYRWKYKDGIWAILKYIHRNIFKSVYREKVYNAFKNVHARYKNAKLITVSEHSKYSILNYLDFLTEKDIDVFYSPILNYSGRQLESDSLKDFGIEKQKYFLTLSSGIWTKNSYRLVKAFDNLVDNNLMHDFKLVLTGFTKPKPFKVKHKDSFLFLGYKPRDVVELLLRNSYALVYPTLNEGFGYPPIEAMKYKVPVIASAISPIIEVNDTLPLYFNPYSIEDIRIKLFQAINDPLFSSDTKKENLHARYSHIQNKQNEDTTKLINMILNLATEK